MEDIFTGSGSMMKEVFNAILKKECLMNDTVFINKIFTMEKRVTSIFGILQSRPRREVHFLKSTPVILLRESYTSYNESYTPSVKHVE